jgi:hypothetical protein
MEEKQNYKLTDEEFDAIYRENFGLCALTAKAIQKQYGIKYSRQAVRERADKKYTQQQKDAMIDDLFDVSISTIVEHLQGEECPPSRLRAANSMISFIFRLTTFKKRFPPPKPEQVYKIHGKIHHFGKGY